MSVFGIFLLVKFDLGEILKIMFLFSLKDFIRVYNETRSYAPHIPHSSLSHTPSSMSSLQFRISFARLLITH